MNSIWFKDANFQIGTTSAPSCFEDSALQQSPQSCISWIETNKLAVISQVHGNEIIKLSFNSFIKRLSCPITNLGKADAVLLSSLDNTPNLEESISIGIRTADCLPIVVHGSDQIGLIHAGWRGLTSGILEKMLKEFECPRVGRNKLNIWIGPAAKKCCYEVGQEVFKALKLQVSDVNSDELEKRARIDLQDIACNIIDNLPVLASIQVDRRCTICDPALYSFRRNATKNRNLTFVRFASKV